MKLSIVVPCYNCRNTIERLLDSIVNNNLPKEDYEIVIVDDNSTDNFMELVEPYKEKADIKCYDSKVDFHCPGNTRQVGLDHVNGEWVTFIDNDDYFEPNVFRQVFELIIENDVQTIVFTSFYRQYEDKKDSFPASESTMLWLHGNFYNVNFLKENNLCFKKDLESHEDIYFNLMVKVQTYLKQNPLYFASELYTYNWVYNKDSLSNWEDGQGLRYLDIHFNDYLYAVTEPLFNANIPHDEFIQKNLMSNFLIIYFYYQAGLYRMGYEYPRDYYPDIVKLRNRLESECGLTNEDLLNYVYGNVELYDLTKKQAYSGVGPFVEIQSFRDFVFHL